MNCLIIVSSFKVGGAEKQAIEDANNLCQDLNIHLIAFSIGPLEKTVDKRVKYEYMKSKNYLHTIFLLVKYIQKNQIEIIHAHLFKPMIISTLAGLLTKTQVIWNFHSHSYGNSKISKKIHKYIAKINSVRVIIFPSKKLIDYYSLENYNFPRNKILKLYNSGQNSLIELIKDSKNDNNIKTIGFIGRLIKLKRIELMINLAEYLLEKEFSNFKIKIVGDGPERNNLEKSCREKGLQNFIEFLGYHEMTIDYYREFDLFALPSEEEVLSLALIDAGLAGVPSIAFNVGGNSEIIDNNKTGFIVESSSEFFSKIYFLLINPEIIKEFGWFSKTTFPKKFGPQIRKANLTRLYEQTISEN